MNVRNTACDMLLSHRIEIKSSSSTDKLKNIENRLFIAHPIKRDNKIREAVTNNNKTSNNNIKQIESENGGPGVFNFDTRQHWKLKNNEWKYDLIPQFYDGKNIADFYQPNIDKQLNELENEEKERMNIDDGDGDGDGDDEVHQLNDDEEKERMNIDDGDGD